MRILKSSFLIMGLAAGIFVGAASAQEKTNANARPGPTAYDLGREMNLIGTVQTFTTAAQTPPLGAHVILQTTSGLVDVHLGDARLLAANHFIIQNGDTLRIVGEVVAYGKGTQFVARIVQKGTQVLAVRSLRGIPLSYMAPRDASGNKAHGGVL
jgi:hypothetical protein